MHFGGKLGSKESGWGVPSDQERKEQDSACGPQSTARDDTRETGTQKTPKKTERKREMLQRDISAQNLEAKGLNAGETLQIMHEGLNMTFSKYLGSLRKRKEESINPPPLHKLEQILHSKPSKMNKLFFPDRQMNSDSDSDSDSLFI